MRAGVARWVKHSRSMDYVVNRNLTRAIPNANRKPYAKLSSCMTSLPCRRRIQPTQAIVKPASSVSRAFFAPMNAKQDPLRNSKGQVTQAIFVFTNMLRKLINDETLYNSAIATVSSLQLAAGEAKTLITDAHGAIGQARDIIDQINAGKGTLGMLAKDPRDRPTAAALAEELRAIEISNAVSSPNLQTIRFFDKQKPAGREDRPDQAQTTLIKEQG